MRKPVDFWIAIVLFVFCGIAAFLTAGIPLAGTGTKWGPAFFPWLMIGGIAILAVVLLLRSFKQAPPTEAGTSTVVYGKMALFLFLMLLYAAFYVHAGYLVATGIFFVVAMLLLGERRPLHVLVIPAGIIAGVYLVFTQIMKVYLP